MMHLTDEELDKLVEQQTRAANKRDEFEALMNADRTVRAITALRTQLTEAHAASVTLAEALQVPEVQALVEAMQTLLTAADGESLADYYDAIETATAALVAIVEGEA